MRPFNFVVIYFSHLCLFRTARSGPFDLRVYCVDCVAEGCIEIVKTDKLMSG